MKNRRKFITDCFVLTLAGMLPGKLSAITFATGAVSLDKIDFTAFRGLVGTRFLVAGSAQQGIPLELISVDELKPTQKVIRPNRYETFSLIFRGSADTTLAQDIYALEHSKLGRLSMLIVPVISRDASRRYYQAIFNRSRAA
ncbi:MAG TPA: hypothetical protein VH597_02325 [Verrucomicrobiae bacterium]|jgi:hypothetical protein|nr:hypothetical protein [Verrucomicrobiae bacterium]